MLPVPNREDAQFWQLTRQRRLAFQCCVNCSALRHPPLAVCPECQHRDVRWVDAPAHAEIYSATVVHHPMDLSVAADVPYVVVVVAFPELPGVRFLSKLVGCQTQPAIGTPVQLQWRTLESGLNLPEFRLSVAAP